MASISLSTADSGAATGQNLLSPTPEFIGVRHKVVDEAPGVSLSFHQKLLVGSVLDLFSGYPTLRHLSLWSPDATFADPLTESAGFEKFAAQWYGLAALFRPEIQSHAVTSAGNPIEVALTNGYTVRGVGTSWTLDSVVRIHVGDDGRIDRVEDRWNDDKLSDDSSVSEAYRKLTAKTASAVVRVPANEEEDMQMRAEREQQSEPSL